MEKSAQIAYARDALRILQASLELMSAGRPEFYRVAAVQLRLLLCDTTRRHGQVVDISLAARLAPGLRLPPLAGNGPPLALADWLEQPLQAGLSVRLLVRRVCDQDGGAHVDRKPQAGPPPAGQSAAWLALIAAAALPALEKQLFEG